MGDMLEGLIRLVVGVVIELVKSMVAEGIMRCLGIPLLYVPGFVVLSVLSLGHYPDEFLGERGQWPCVLGSVALWLALAPSTFHSTAEFLR